MSNEMSRRDFLKNLKKLGITAGVGSAVLFLGASNLNAGSFEDAGARGMCGAGMNCSGGNGQCGVHRTAFGLRRFAGSTTRSRRAASRPSHRADCPRVGRPR